jgi:catechol 2,3-dioxygenase
MALKGVLRLGEAMIRVTDMEAALRHYDQRLGLHCVWRDEQGRAYLKAWDELDHHSIVLRVADQPGCDYFAFKVADDATLSDFENRIRARGTAVKRIEAGVHPRSGRRIEFVLPSGHVMQLYAEKEQVGNTLGTRNPGVLPDEGVIRGLRINRLDHILLGGVSLDENVAFFREVLDFSLSEKLIDHETGASLVVFLTCSNKPHDIAFVLQPEPNRFHHVAFLLMSENDVMHAADMIGKYRIPVEVGLNRHGITRGATIYFLDPSGNRNEVFSGGYVYYPDSPTLVWDTRALGEAVFSQDRQPRESFLNQLT